MRAWPYRWYAEATGTTGILQGGARTSATSIATIISRADNEIDQRIKSLNDLIARIGSMKKISADELNNLTVSVQNEINELTVLKAKIDSDTSTPTAVIDYKSITKSYRIYALVLPQVRIIVASDRVLTIIDSMNSVGSKVRSRISGLTGTNVVAINQIFSDFTSKITDARAQSGTAVSTVSGLQPDQGNQTKMQANTAALKSARSNIKTATDDLIAARKDIGTIIKDLKEIGGATNVINNSANPPTSQTPQ